MLTQARRQRAPDEDGSLLAPGKGAWGDCGTARVHAGVVPNCGASSAAVQRPAYNGL
jgi:hypothetical protein